MKQQGVPPQPLFNLQLTILCISTGTTWALYALAKDKKIQEKLREELLTVPIDNPTMEVLNSLQYLDAVVREALRLYPPVSGTLRAAAKEDILPLESPVIDRKGKMHDHIKRVFSIFVLRPIRLNFGTGSQRGKI